MSSMAHRSSSESVMEISRALAERGFKGMVSVRNGAIVVDPETEKDAGIVRTLFGNLPPEPGGPWWAK